MKKILIGILAIILGGFMLVSPVLAADDCILTSVLGGSTCDKNGKKIHDGSPDPSKPEEVNCSCDSGKGESVTHIFELVVDILSIGVGILGVVGISVVGTQYLTAGGNEEKTRKAKRRLLEIVIGLVAYVVIYAFLRWLNPAMP